VPLVDLELRLAGNDVIWAPDLLENASSPTEGVSVHSLFEGWLAGLRDMGTLVPRLDTGEGKHWFELDVGQWASGPPLIHRFTYWIHLCESHPLSHRGQMETTSEAQPAADRSAFDSQHSTLIEANCLCNAF